MWKKADQHKVLCHVCGDKLQLQRTCRRVSFYCSNCDLHYSLSQLAKDLDDQIDDVLGDVRCDRI